MGKTWGSVGRGLDEQLSESVVAYHVIYDSLFHFHVIVLLAFIAWCLEALCKIIVSIIE